MNWTKTKPTEPGWYWYREPWFQDGAPVLLQVTKHVYPDLLAEWNGQEIGAAPACEFIKNLHGEWQPVQPPTV